MMEVFDSLKAKFFDNLSQPQKIYLFAFLLQLLFFATDDLIAFSTIGFIAIIGIAMEVWPKFVAAWNNLLGRFIIIISYAIVANFAVAFAAQKVNEVIGIDPSPLFYSIGFATLLMAPIWMLTLSATVMVFYVIFLQSLILLRIFLKIIRLDKLFQSKAPKSSLSLALLKLFLIPAMLTTLTSAIEFYSGEFKSANMQQTVKDIGKSSPYNNRVDDNNVAGDSSTEADLSKSKEQEIAEEILAATRVEDNITGITDGKATNETDKEVDDDEELDYDFTFNHLIAIFVHNVELFKFSQCIKTDKERVLSIGEFDILVSTPDKNAQYGHKFTVRNCQLKSF
ncbi:hypothetical protein KO525_10570 [Psychrosphaera sp. B3R10]|uniref:hypothetical protein n=1 Tax=unclassified Psychrosphaera TaxID=2641570 RepID=UPI001C09491E|nr:MULTISPECIES: hypothetical protein [unclassified Psychrosphaera]MBU2883644.1 hypothetical protein [Psychrosphaera sp. I2R16]MBU2989822.1 hypothetical protein [Psychrosphaera sp. B3R10]